MRGSNNGTSLAAQQHGSGTDAHRMLSKQLLMLVKSRVNGLKKQPAKLGAGKHVQQHHVNRTQ